MFCRTCFFEVADTLKPMRDLEAALRQLGRRSVESVSAANAELAHLDVSVPAEKQVQAVRSILSKLLASVEQQSTALTLYPVSLSEARAVLERLGHKVEAVERELADTNRELAETNKELAQMKEQILLRQAAYTFASLVEDFVFVGASTEQFQTLSLKEYSDFDLTVEQQNRWEQVQRFASFHVGHGQLIKIDKMLRKGRFQLAHGEEKDKKKADLQAMEGWAARYYKKPQAVNATKGYLRMLNKFSDSAHPLLPSKTMADVLSQK